ncbi:AAA family ATPase [Actinocorallia longicatena]|uniref:WD40 repeat protein n=1 Tax=Actinocorallia longicatena TaxID=111803 RepID=A0ABP6QKD6_9ACTN
MQLLDHAPWVASLHSGERELEPFGSAVVIDARRLLTAAHAVPDEVWAAFPMARPVPAHRLRVAVVRRSAPEFDVAVLELEDEIPPGVRPAALRSPLPEDLAGRPWWAHGFPERDHLGGRSDGRFGPAALGYGTVRLDTTSPYRLTRGFSGTGVWSPDYRAVVGVLGFTDERGNGKAITLWQADQALPEEKLGELLRAGARHSGELAMTSWGWSLTTDPEAGQHWVPRARGVTVDRERGHRFRGRRAALTEVTSWLDRPRPDGRVLVVTGSPGAGKSAVLGRVVTTADPELRASLPPDDDAVRAATGSVSCAVHAKGKTALEIAEEVARAASARLPARLHELIPALRERIDGRRFTLVLDALDESSTPAQARLIVTEILLPLLRDCPSAEIVVGSRRRDDAGDLLASFGPTLHLVDLDEPAYFSPADLESYALATLRLEGAERHGNPYNDPSAAGPLAHRVAALSGGNFLIAGLTARRHGLYDSVPATPAAVSFTADVEEALGAYLARIPRIRGLSAADLLTALSFAEAPGLPLALWQTATEALTGRPLPEEDLAEFVGSSAANFLVESGHTAGEPVYRLFHQALDDALLRAWTRSGTGTALTRAFHAYGRSKGWSAAPSYLLRSLPGHAALCGLMDDLLADDDYLLHVDLARLMAFTDRVGTEAGRNRAALLRLTPQAVALDAPGRAAAFGVTEALEQRLGRSFRGDGRPRPYRARWAVAPPSVERMRLHHPSELTAVCTLPGPDGAARLVTTGHDGGARIWDPVSGRELRAFTRQADGATDVCAFRGAGGEARIVTTGGAVSIWDPETGRELRGLDGHGHGVTGVCAFPGAGGAVRLATIGDDLTIRIWDPETGGELRALTGHTGVMTGVCAFLGADGAHRIATTGLDRTVRIWDPDAEGETRILTGHSSAVLGVCAFSGAGGAVRLATIGDDQTIRIWDPDTGAEVRSHLHDDRMTGLCAFSGPGGTARLATVGRYGTVRVWDPETSGLLRVLTGHKGAVRGVCRFTGTGGTDHLATVGHDRTLRIWDPETGRESEVDGRALQVTGALTLPAPDGRGPVATSGIDGTLRTWHPETGRELQAFTGHTKAVTSMGLLHDDRGRPHIVTASDDRSVRIWDPTGANARDLPPSDGLTVHLTSATSVRAFTRPDGATQVALTVADRSVRIWDPATGRKVRAIGGDIDYVTAACAFPGSDGGVHLAMTGTDATVRIWRDGRRWPGRGRGWRELDVKAVHLFPWGPPDTLLLISPLGRLALYDASTDDVEDVTQIEEVVTAACVLPDGAGGRLLAVAQSGVVRLLRPGHPQPVLTLVIGRSVRALAEVDGGLAIGMDPGLLVVDLDPADLPTA